MLCPFCTIIVLLLYIFQGSDLEWANVSNYSEATNIPIQQIRTDKQERAECMFVGQGLLDGVVDAHILEDLNQVLPLETLFDPLYAI